MFVGISKVPIFLCHPVYTKWKLDHFSVLFPSFVDRSLGGYFQLYICFVNLYVKTRYNV